MRQGAHLGCHHREAPPRLPGARGLYRRIQRQDVGLEGQAVNHADDFIHPAGAGFNRLNRRNGLTHADGALLCGLAHTLCHPV